MKQSQVSWTQLWQEFEKIWQDHIMIGSFGRDRGVMLLRLTATELFKRNQDNPIIRQALIDLDSGVYFQE